MTRSRHILGPRRHWTPSETAILRREYPNRPAAEIARKLGCTMARVYSRATKMGLHKSAAFLATDLSGRIQRGRQDPRMVATQFRKGNVPQNKGLRRPGWAPGRMAETQFKTRRPEESHNYKPIGSLRVNHDGNLERKVTDNPKIVTSRRWVPVSRLVWIKHRGKIPRGHVIAFKKGRHTAELKKITIGRLECISQAENMRRNSIWMRFPKPVAQLIHLRGHLNRRIREKESHAQDHQ